MILTIEGIAGRKLECLEEAAKFFALALMDKRMVNNLTIDIEVGKRTDFVGQCVNEDGTKRSRWFTIELRDQKIEEMVKTLAHEMVHVKQHAKNELGEKNMILHKDGFEIETMWCGNIWRPKKGEDAYYDSPWEIEAYGREVGLAYRFMKHWEAINS